MVDDSTLSTEVALSRNTERQAVSILAIFTSSPRFLGNKGGSCHTSQWSFFQVPGSRLSLTKSHVSVKLTLLLPSKKDFASASELLITSPVSKLERKDLASLYSLIINHSRLGAPFKVNSTAVVGRQSGKIATVVLTITEKQSDWSLYK